MATLFISDLHLDSSRPAVVRAFLSFLDTEARSAEALYILGDLFEAWIGDDEDSPLAGTIRQALKALTASVPVFFMHGNRDFLVGERFCAETGCRLIADPSVIEINGTQALLMHGDTLCTADTDYLAFRTQVRDPQWQATFLAKSLPERRQVAAGLREGSRQASTGKSAGIMDVTPAEVKRIMQEHDVSLLIHGHTHRPACHQEAAGTRLVLGDWEQSGWAIRWDESGPRLASFAIA